MPGSRPASSRCTPLRQGSTRPTAGLGIADQLRVAMVRDGLDHEAATRRIWPIDKQGLLVETMSDPRDL
ncbi:hypothetical protein OG417_29500 [Actinoallomurus sp. NBC_01490]|uniref:malic enzyme-like NAD(P)-binding protein n=1 Tax=Actinoallomurus sp. NBC_01490 TaxID=2903557 RepID=UPI002E310991|nr:malic enzyme-like NAD(P)-binding protein [Actinoallomurus sp. NBC_01490]